MADRERRVSAAEIALLGLLLIWALFPVVVLLIDAHQQHSRMTGVDGLVGGAGALGADQLQYLAWIRDAAHHWLASDLFSLAPGGHVYLEPLFTLSGLLIRAGLSIQVAYLLWKPVAALALGWAAIAWARRAFDGELGPRVAAAILALFLYTPLTELFSWAQLASKWFRFELYLLGDEVLGAGKLWGYAPSAIGLACMVGAILCVDRSLDPSAGERPAERALSRRVGRKFLVLATLLALMAAWLHPWQGITLIIALMALLTLQWRLGGPAVILPMLGAALPLIYYYVLGHSDPAWELASKTEMIPRLPPLVLLAGFGPVAALAAFGVRRPNGIVFEQLLLIWIGACFVTYFVNNAFAPHALQGLSFPLSVLAVRGWRRLPFPRAAAVVAILLVTVPGLAFNVRKFTRVASGMHVAYYLTPSEQGALAWVSDHAPPGGVLAPTPFSAVIPGATGRRVWVGHGYWTPDYAQREREARKFFHGDMPVATAQRFAHGTGATVLVSDCRFHRDLRRRYPMLIATEHRFGCARVYVLRGGRSATR